MEYQAFCVRAQSVKGIDGTYRRRKEAGVEAKRCVALKFLYVSKVMMMAERNSELEIKICSNFESTYLSPSSLLFNNYYRVYIQVHPYIFCE